MATERPGQTLGATALVHEAWLRLEKSAPGQWRDRSQFFAAAAEAMRRILVEAARRRLAAKRGGGLKAEQVEDLHLPTPLPDEELLAVHEALEDLDREDGTAGADCEAPLLRRPEQRGNSGSSRGQRKDRATPVGAGESLALSNPERGGVVGRPGLTGLDGCVRAVPQYGFQGSIFSVPCPFIAAECAGIDKMTSNRAQTLFARAHEMEAAARDSFLTGECGEDLELRVQVQRMLADAEKADALF